MNLYDKYHKAREDTITIFLIPGFGQQPDEPQFKWLEEYLHEANYRIIKVSVKWKYSVMSDYVKHFEDVFENNKSRCNYILGFSFGAMIAYISAPKLNPDKILLCSLSPYFKEDSNTWKKSWEKDLGKNRVEDLMKYSANSIAKMITSKTILFYGTKEAKAFPALKKRSVEALQSIRNSRLITIQAAPHNIAYPGYKEAIKQELG